MNRIRYCREKLGLTQAQLAEKMNCTGMTISRYEKGTRQLDPPSISRLCDIFECTADYLICRSSSPSASVSDEDAALLAAYHAADGNIKNAIDALLQPWLEIEAEDARSQV